MYLMYLFWILDHFLHQEKLKTLAKNEVKAVKVSGYKKNFYGLKLLKIKKGDIWHPLTSPPPKSDKNHFFLNLPLLMK